MDDHDELNAELQPIDSLGSAETRTPNGAGNDARPKPISMSNEPPHRDLHSTREAAGVGVDGWSVAEFLLARWRWLLLGGCLMGTLAGLTGMLAWKKTYTAVAQLLRFEPISSGEYFKPPTLTPDTFAGMLKSPELLQRIATNLQPQLTPELLAKCSFIKTDPDSDLVKVAVKARSLPYALDAANLYASEAVHYMRELQKREALEVNNNYLKRQLKEMDQDISVLQNQFKALPQAGSVAVKLSQVGGSVSNLAQQLQISPRPSVVTARLTDQLQKALDDLGNLTRRYTDAHPLVIQQRAQIATLQNELATATTNANAMPGLPLGMAANAGGFEPDYDVIRNKLLALAYSRQQLADRQREAEAFADNPPGNVRFFAPATAKGAIRDRRWLKISVTTVFGVMLGVMFATGGVLLVEFLDERIKTAEDVRRVTRLPVLATLDDLGTRGQAERDQWAFCTWTMLQGRLSPTANHGLVCGITSSREGEGRSTWIHLLAEAASLSGFRVLTIATRPAMNGDQIPGQPELPANPPPGENSDAPGTALLTPNVLTSPAEVTEQLTGPNPQPLVHIPLPGWVWNLERRLQWREALKSWRKIENLVILVELPPASVPEAVLLGENLPNLIWLANSGTADAGETRAQLETLRHARCKLAGAVLNRETAPPLKGRFPRWLGCILLFLALWIGSAQAQETNAPGAFPAIQNNAAFGTNKFFSATTPGQRGNWQRRLTLGPGDVLTFSLYGEPELTEPDVFIGPDGRVGFLEAQSVMASGLTVDELRTNLDRELGKYRRAPRTVVTPVAYRSKKYYMLGRVVQRGAYTLDQPLTILEAVARARGLETGLSDRNVLDLADFQKCFLMRGGKRYPVDFEKLFTQGDLSQNITLEPDDYLYFPSAGLREVYVLGQVRFPGVVPYTDQLTTVGAIAARGGFTDIAYKSRILVIRGSLHHPEGFVVDTRAIVDGRGQDFRLEPRDIIFVSSRPFVRVEQLLDLAATAFLQSVTAEWTGGNIGPIFPDPFVPNF